MESNQNGQEKEPQQGEKTFTQEEVNRIVQERLARVKTEPSERETELNAREKELDARERRMNAREILTEKKLPVELLDVLDYSDEKKMQDHIKILEKTYASAQKGPAYSPTGGGTPPKFDAVREAMGLKG